MDKIPQPKLYDAKSGAPLELPEDQIGQAVASGKAAFVKGDQIPVVDSNGSTFLVPAEEASRAFSQGYHYEPLASQQERALKHQYGDNPLETAKAGLEGAASMATLGGSDLAEEALFHNAEARGARAKYNPLAHGAGEVAGAVLPALLTGGTSVAAEAAAPTLAQKIAAALPISKVTQLGEGVAKKVAQKVGTEGAESLASRVLLSAIPRGAGSAVEGAFFGGKQALSEYSLGDPELTAEKAMAEVGFGAAAGGLIGITVGGIKGGVEYKAASKAEKPFIEQAARDQIAGEGGEAASAGMAAPSSIEDIMQRNEEGTYQGLSAELPQKARLLEAEAQEGPMQFPVTEAHKLALDNKAAYDRLGVIRESSDHAAQAFRDYETHMKAERVGAIRGIIKNLAPEYKPTGDASEAGNRLVNAFVDSYKKSKESLAPIFEKIKAAGETEINPQAIESVLDSTLPGAREYLEKDASGALKLQPYEATMPYSRATYDSIKDLVQAANKDKLTLNHIRNLRDTIADRIKWDAAPREQAELGSLKKALMDSMQEHAESVLPGDQVREAFKAYAINEQNKELLERVLGGKFSVRADLLRQVKPEAVMDKIFRDTAHVKAARQVLGEQEFNKALSDHLMEQFQKVTDKNTFSSNKFGSYLARNKDALREAFAGSPAFSRMQAVNDVMRIVPDSASINPSGTAKTLIGMVGHLKHIAEGMREAKTIMGALGELAHKIPELVEHKGVEWDLNAMLRGEVPPEDPSLASRVAKYLQLQKLEKLSQKTTKAIHGAIKGFIENKPGVEVPASVHFLEEHNFGAKAFGRTPANEHEDHCERHMDSLNTAASDPAHFADQISRKLSGISEHAPGVAGALTQKIIQATQFLYEKAPKNPNIGFGINPMLRKWKPSDAEKAKFERYSKAVEDPLSVLHDMKNGVISREGVEAIKLVYPKLYGEVVAGLSEHLSELKHELPYAKRLQISTLFGVPVDASSSPQFIAQMQAFHMQAQAQDGANNPQGAVRASGASKIKAPNSAMSGTERVLKRM